MKGRVDLQVDNILDNNNIITIMQLEFINDKYKDMLTENVIVYIRIIKIKHY